jgi:VCBS repeat-containing protein
MLRGSYGENADHAHVARLSLSEGPAPDRVEIGDMQFLFTAHFKKSGADLVLAGDDGHKLILVDYFNLAHRPDLTSHGATMSADLVMRLAGSDAPGQYAQAGAPSGAQVIGKCERLGGSATVQHANGVVEDLRVGEAILKGDIVMTNDGSSAVLSLLDGTVFDMGASARMVLSELLYDANSTSNSEFVSLVRGTITFVAGQVARTGNMAVETPVATLGIRGTTVHAVINADPSGTVYTVDVSLMSDPDGHVGRFQAQDRVTGAALGELSTTSNVLSITTGGAQQNPKSPAEVQAELAIAQVLFPIYQAVAATVPQPPAPPSQTVPPGGSPNATPPGGSLTPPQDLPPVISISATVNTADNSVHVTSITSTTTPPTTPAQTTPINNFPITTPTPTPPPIQPHNLQLVNVTGTAEVETNSVISGNLLADDPNQPSLTITGVARDSANNNTFTVEGIYGELVVQADGNYTYILAPSNHPEEQAALNALNALGGGHSASDEFTFTVSDGSGGIGQANLTVSVTSVAQPVGQDTTAVVQESVSFEHPTQVTLTPHATGTNSNNFTYTLDTALLVSGSVTSHGGTVVANGDGTFTYTPAPGFHGTDMIPFEAHDGPHITSADFNITVDVNAPPAVVPDLTTAAGAITAVPLNSAGSPLTPIAASYLTDGNVLIDGLGGPAGFGENVLAVGDDNSSSAINITSVFGPQGLDFFGHNYTSLYINNNGNITFAEPNGAFTPSQINAGANNPIIAPFWADVDTRGGPGIPTGGNATGSNHVYYNLDSANGVLTVTWDDVGYYFEHSDKLDAFQVQLISVGNGNFDIVYRYQDITWTTGDASNGSGGLGGSVARAGYSAGDGVHYFELPQSGNQAQMLALANTEGDTGIAGLDVFQVNSGSVLPTSLTTSGDIVFSDPDTGDTHSITNVTYTGPGAASLGTLSLVKDSDTSGSSDVGQFTWTYSVAPASVAFLSAGEERTETFDVTISDGNGGTAQQTITVNLQGAAQGPSVSGITLGTALLDGSTPSTSITVNFSEKVTDFTGADLVLPSGVTLSNGTLAANGLSFTATLTAGANIADETLAVTVTGGSYHDATGNAGAAFTGPTLEVNTQGPSVTGITLGTALLDGSTASTTITVSFSEKVTDFTGADLVLPSGVTLTNGTLAANGLSFTATLTAGANIADESQAVAVTGGSYRDATGNAGAAFTGPTLEVNTLPVLTVGVSVVDNLPVQEGQTLFATATISNDTADVGATINYQWQSSSDGGLTWANVGGAISGNFNGALSSFLQLTERQEGQQLRAQSSFTDSGGQLITATSSPTVAVADVTPVITAPFSYAVDDLSIVKNGTEIYNNTFSQAPPASPTILSNGVPVPIVFLTLGSTWTEAGGKAILSSTGLAPNTVVSGSDWDLALLNTNTDPTSELGLKEDAAFTVSSTFDLTVSPPGNYGMELTDGTSAHSPDQVVRLVVQGLSNGNTVVELVQANLATNPGTSTVLTSQTLTAAQLASNNQIEFQLSHAANSTAIAGTFELLNGGNVTNTTTFTPTATIFTNGVNWTRVDIGAFTNPAVALNVGAGQSPREGQTLTASASTNDSDATINYQWQESSNSSFATVTNIGTNSTTYVVQPADEGSFIRVVATTSDPDNAQSATATSQVTGAVLSAAPMLNIASHTLSVDVGNDTINSGVALELAGASTADIIFTNSSGDSGSLVLDHSSSFAGQISGFAGDGNVLNLYSIDLKDVNFATAKETYADGTLTVSYGVDVANIHFNGSYELGNFILSSDGHGGTLVVDPPIAGNASVTSSQSTDSLDQVTAHDINQMNVATSSENNGSHKEQHVDTPWMKDFVSLEGGPDHFDFGTSDLRLNSTSPQFATLIASNSLGTVVEGQDSFNFPSHPTAGSLSNPAGDFGNHSILDGHLGGPFTSLGAGIEALQSGPEQHGNSVITDFHQGQGAVGLSAFGVSQSQLQAIIAATTSDNHTFTQAPNETVAIGEMIAQLNASHGPLIHH